MTYGGDRVKPDELRASSAPEAAGAPDTVEAASPFPPAFRWEASPSEAPTQVFGAIDANTAGSDAPATTHAIRSSPAYQQRPSHVEDLFQPVDRPTDSSAPPWAESDLPPIAEQQDAWMRRNPEAFKPAAAASRSKQIIGIAVLAIVVLGLVGATVAYFLTGSPDRTGRGQSAAPLIAPARDLPAPPAPLPAPADTASALIEPPGRSRGGGGLFDLPKLESSNLLPQPVLNALGGAGMTDGVLKTTTVDDSTIGMFALTLPDQRAAIDVAQTIATVQRDGGLRPDDNRSLQGVAVLGSDPSLASTAYRTVYVLYNRVIYFEVFGPDREAVLTNFDSLFHQQVAHAPPTVWTGR
ncbi:MAG: hypothetical protein M3186_17670 [Actinomycetota bacterium]|nr:hypothetical protein [Actinomycetota bacterium]